MHRMTYRTRILGSIGAGWLAALAPGIGWAQTPDSAAETVPPGDQGLQDIVVTAQRRDESLSRTPVAVAVLTAEALKDAQVNSEQDLRLATPGLAVRATLNSNQLNFSLRGQSQDGLSGTRPGVLPYLNEVQISGNAGATAFYDLQSVQVLKGPQGTLFGRSATGGAVLFTTARPSDAFEGYASALGGNLNALKFEGAVGGPLGDDALQGRIAAVYTRRDGFQRNILDGGREGDYERWGIRASFTAHLSDRLRNDLVFDYFRSDSESTVGVISGLLPLGTPGTPPFFPSELLYGGTADPTARAIGIATLSAISGASPAAAAAAYDAYFANPNHPANGLRGVLADQQARGPFKVASDANNSYRTNNRIVTNTSRFDLTDALQIKNIFGFARIRSATAFEIDGTPFNIASQGLKGTDQAFAIDTRQVSNEFQIIGGAPGDRLSYVAGFYFSDEKATNLYYSDFFDLAVAPYGLGAQVVRNQFIIRNKTYAGYAQGTYGINDSGLSVTAGLRYTSEKVGKETLPGDSGRIAAGDPAPPGFDYDKSRTFDRLSWQFGVQDQVDPGLLLYAVTRRAYKSGGYNGSVSRDGPAVQGGDHYDAEQVTDVELGAKYNGTVGATPARATLALFHNWLKDSQRTAFTIVDGAPAAITVNVPQGRIYGAELEASLRPLDWLTIGGNLNYTKAKFTDGNVVANGSAQVFDRLPDTPRYSGAAYADVTVPVTGTLDLTLHGDVYRQAKTYTSPRSANFAGTTVPAYTLVTLRAGVQDRDTGWSLIANLKNVFDKTYYVGGGAAGEIYQINTLLVGEPRTITIEARYSF